LDLQKNESELQVVVLSRNRELLLKRSIENWNLLPYRFHIYHNSARRLELRVESNIKYFHCPNLNFSERAELAIGNLNGDFAILLADDDRLVRTGISSALKVFNSDDELQSVGGKVFGTYLYGRRVTGSYAYAEMYKHANSSDDLIERVKYHFNYNSEYFVPRGSLYRIYRIESFKRILRLISKMKSVTTPYIHELIGEFSNPCLGKTATIDEIYWIRNWENEMSQFPDWDRRSNLYNWWKNPKNRSQVDDLIMALSEEFMIEQEFVRSQLDFYIDSRMEMDTKGNVQRSKYRILTQNIKERLSCLNFMPGIPKEIEAALKGNLIPNSKENVEEVLAISKSMFDSVSRQAL